MNASLMTLTMVLFISKLCSHYYYYIIDAASEIVLHLEEAAFISEDLIIRLFKENSAVRNVKALFMDISHKHLLEMMA